jgi:hypothetical protein
MSWAAAIQPFFIDNYGADPTGATLSDAAWTAAYSAAAAWIHSLGGTSATSGAVIVLGSGLYTFSLGVISTTDARIGLIGQGKAATVLRSTGSNGKLISFTGGSEPGTVGAAPVGGFTLYGWDAGNNVDGLFYGDRYYATLFDIFSHGFGGTTSRAFHFYSAGGAGLEAADALSLVAKSSTIGFCWDGDGVHSSFDYSRWDCHAVANGVNFQVINHAHCWGGDLTWHGTVGGPLFASYTGIQVGSGGTDDAQITASRLNVGMELDTSSAATNTDMILNGSSAGGIWQCYGQMLFLVAAGAWTTGSITGSRFAFSGPVLGSPLLLGTEGPSTRMDRAQAIEYHADSVQPLSSSSTIKTASDGRFGLIPVSETGNVTGIILEAPARTNTEITIINRSNFTIAFASSNSNVADGSADIIPALAARSFVYDAGTTLWYRAG